MIAGAAVRFPVDPRDVPLPKAARRLGMTEADFVGLRDRLFARGFPRPDPDTGHYDLKAIDAWMDSRSGLTPAASSPHASTRCRSKLEAAFGKGS